MKKLEQLKRLVSYESKMDKMNSEWGYLVNHYFPHFHPPQRYPDFFSFPTHVVSPKNELIVSAVGGVLTMYWNPAITVQNLSQDAAPTANFEKYTTLLVNTNATDHITANVLNDISTWGAANRYHGFSSAKHFKRARLVSGYLELEYIGKPLDATGVIKVGMTLLPYGSDIKSLNVDVTKLQDLPIYGSFRCDEKIVIFYRHIDDSHFALGPYDAATSFPVVFIHGSNVGTAQFKVTIVRSFEGILNSNVASFVVQSKEQESNVNANAIKQRYGSFGMPEIMAWNSYVDRYNKLFQDANFKLAPPNPGQNAVLYRAYKHLKNNSELAPISPPVPDPNSRERRNTNADGGPIDQIINLVNSIFTPFVEILNNAANMDLETAKQRARPLYNRLRAGLARYTGLQLPEFEQLTQPLEMMAEFFQNIQRDPVDAYNRFMDHINRMQEVA